VAGLERQAPSGEWRPSPDPELSRQEPLSNALTHLFRARRALLRKAHPPAWEGRRGAGPEGDEDPAPEYQNN